MSENGAPGEARTPDPLLRSYAVQNSKCRFWCRLRGNALPPPTGEPRRFLLSGSSIAALLRSPANRDCASIEISQLESILELRLNEEVTVPFARIALGGVFPIGPTFPKPLLPWPELKPVVKIDEAVDPRGWAYSVCYWIENSAHHLIIPESHRPLRDIAFLGAEDEIMIVAPSTNLEFAWGQCERPASTTVHARVSWRQRHNVEVNVSRRGPASSK
jgi:hypothetical protein